MEKSKSILLFICVILVLAGGLFSGLSSIESINTWYVALQKPFFTPPNYLFSPVWTILYMMLGYVLFLLISLESSSQKKYFITLFSVQLLLNYSWSLVFFGFHQIFAALIIIVSIVVFVFILAMSLWKEHKKIAYLLVPYLVWISYATALNAAIWYLN